ncbi:MAG: hypothetical protein ACRDPT_14550 [Streptomycetales bacterium]
MSDTGDTPMAVDHAANAVEQAVVTLGGRCQRTEDSESLIELRSTFGSRLAFRLFGVYMSAGRRRMPIKMETQVLAVGRHQTLVTIKACSDEGSYLYRLPTMEAEYERALTKLVSQVRASVDSPEIKRR